MRMQPKQFTSWSFSRYSLYRQCPFRAKLQNLDKIQEPKTPALVNGAEVHEQAEHYLKGSIRTLPASLAYFRDLFMTLRKQYKAGKNITVEATWAFTKNWAVTRWDDWTGCWLRIKTDVTYFEKDMTTLHILDWKTGRFRESMAVEYEEQLDLYALGALLMYPRAEVVIPRLVYLDAGLSYPVVPKRYGQNDLPRLQKAWEKKTKAMLNDTKFTPRPNDKCVWCFYRASNRANGGGQCKY